MSYNTVTYDVRDDGIATMTLNRPEKLNSFTREMFDEWRDVIAKVAYDDDVRVFVITGAGRAFSSGVDLSVLGSEKKPPAFRFYYRQAHQSCRRSGVAGEAGDRGGQRGCATAAGSSWH